MLADDDERLLASLVRTMRQLGLRVATATNGHIALDALRTGERFCALVTDIEMPVMTGLELVRRLDEEGIAVPTVLISASHRQVPLTPQRAFLAKPFVMSELVAALDSVGAHLGRGRER